MMERIPRKDLEYSLRGADIVLGKNSRSNYFKCCLNEKVASRATASNAHRRIGYNMFGEGALTSYAKSAIL